MKIAIFTDSFCPGIGGTEGAVLRYATELAKNDSVMVLAPSYNEPVDDGGFSFKVLRAKSLQVTKNDYWALPSFTGSLKRGLEEFSPDVIHCQTLGMMAGYANKYAKKHGVPLVYTVHTKFRYCYKQALKLDFLSEMLLKHVMRRVKKGDVICSVSDSMKDELKSYGIKKPVTIIRNGCESFDKPCEYERSDDRFTLLYVGRIIDYKNLKFSFDLLKELKKIRSDFAFVLAGSGPHEKMFKKYAEKQGLSDNVKFIGAIRDKQKLHSVYAGADLVLFPSVFDNDSLILIESACAGTPALVMRGTGSAERITDGVNGFVADGNEKAFADYINLLMNDRKKLDYAGQNAHGILNSWRETVDEYRKIYNDLLNNNR